MPGSFIRDALKRSWAFLRRCFYQRRRLVIPVKKALDVGLARNEEALCREHHLDPAVVEAAALGAALGAQAPKSTPQETPGGLLERL